MSRTYRYGEKPRRSYSDNETFRCRRCKMLVGPVQVGGKHRNHCPYCLFSRHVDGRVPGDRASDCGGVMAPIGIFTRPKGEQAIVHRCLSCGFERHNRVAADDDWEMVLQLPAVEPPFARPARGEQDKPLTA